MALHQPFAVLLCRFADSAATPPRDAAFYERLIVRSGTGGLNDYWSAASLGAVDLDGSRVFGWITLPQTRDEFVAQHVDRWSRILGAITAFPDVPFDDFVGVISCFSDDVADAGAANNGVLANVDCWNVTFLGHETGHVMGLDHSFDESVRQAADWAAPGEYFDMSDIMSAMNVHHDAGHEFSPRGPMASVAHLDRMNWLPTGRVWRPGTNGSGVDQFDLVALTHPEVSGYLAAQVGGVHLEFHVPDGFDAGLPQAAVRIHQLRGTNPVVIARQSAPGGDWLPGSTFGPDPAALLVHGGTELTIESFDLQRPTARVSVRITAPARIPQLVGDPSFGVTVDGGGYVVLPSGKIIKVPPRGPVMELLANVESLVDAQARESLLSAHQLAAIDATTGLIQSLRSGHHV